MKTTLALLAATTALGAFAAIPAIGAIRTSDAGSPPTAFSARADATQDGMVLLASDDAEEDDEEEDDDDEEEEDDDDGCEDDDEGGCGAGSNPAPAGTVAPPANGLFGNGAAPRVKLN